MREGCEQTLWDPGLKHPARPSSGSRSVSRISPAEAARSVGQGPLTRAGSPSAARELCSDFTLGHGCCELGVNGAITHASAGDRDAHQEKDKSILTHASNFRAKLNYYYSNVRSVFVTTQREANRSPGPVASVSLLGGTALPPRAPTHTSSRFAGQGAGRGPFQ